MFCSIISSCCCLLCGPMIDWWDRKELDDISSQMSLAVSPIRHVSRRTVSNRTGATNQRDREESRELNATRFRFLFVVFVETLRRSQRDGCWLSALTTYSVANGTQARRGCLVHIGGPQFHDGDDAHLSINADGQQIQHAAQRAPS